MNKVLLNYLLKGFLKSFLIIVCVFYCFGFILNLLEEVEFFKNIDVNFTTVAKKKVITVGIPENTSGVHAWNGKIDNLIKKENIIKIKPMIKK